MKDNYVKEPFDVSLGVAKDGLDTQQPSLGGMQQSFQSGVRKKHDGIGQLPHKWS